MGAGSKAFGQNFCCCYFKVWGGSSFQLPPLLWSGHMTDKGKKFKNLAILTQGAIEGTQGIHSAFVPSATQKGGQVGKAKSKLMRCEIS